MTRAVLLMLLGLLIFGCSNEPSGCVPQCTGVVCGDNGCDGVCGVCETGEMCIAGACLCKPDCRLKQCGDDGCGGQCGACGDGFQCEQTIGRCVCEPVCDDKECGDDTCGGICGLCPVGGRCLEGLCCEPACDDKECGPDGCGGICGTCPTGFPCEAGQCNCIPDCGGKQCGDDGCFGTCGECIGGGICQDDSTCCAPDCAGKFCGDDGCGGDCGQCGAGALCLDSQVCCTPDCTGKCADDGCGGQCEECVEGSICLESGACCTPDCEGKACGEDGCGGSCGDCVEGSACETGLCVAPPVMCPNLDEGTSLPANGCEGADGCDTVCVEFCDWKTCTCTSDEDCPALAPHCIANTEWVEGKICAPKCGGAAQACPAGTDCKTLWNGGAPGSFCTTLEPAYCAPCSVNSDCLLLTDRCVDVGDSTHCVAGCEEEACPDGFVCLENGDGKVCIPDAGCPAD